MFRIAQLALALALLAGPTYAADKLTFTCSGTSVLERQDGVIPVIGQSLVFDLDGKTVTGSLGTFSIYEITETSIKFQTSSSSGSRTAGHFDRSSGLATLEMSGSKNFDGVFKLTCKPAKPLADP